MPKKAKKKVSKSVAKRRQAQVEPVLLTTGLDALSTRIDALEKRVTKAGPQPNRSTGYQKELDDALKRIEALEQQYEFIANELRPVFGLAAVALVFDAVHERLNK